MRWAEGLVSLTVLNLLPLDCIGRFTFLHKLRWTMVGMLLLNTLFSAAWRAAQLRAATSRRALGASARIAYSWVLANSLLYISTSSTLFRTFPCERFDDGRRLLRADYSIDCDGPAHAWHVVLASLGVVGFVFGVPLAFFVLLVRERRRESAKNDEGRTFNPVVAVLAESYGDHAFFAEPLFCVQKVTVSGLLVFIPPSLAQLLTGIVVACWWGISLAYLAPYPSMGENLVLDGLNFAQILMLLGALALKLERSVETGLANKVTESFLWLCAVLPLVIVVVALVSEICCGDAVDADTWQRLRRRLPFSWNDGAASDAPAADKDNDENDDETGGAEAGSGSLELGTVDLSQPRVGGPSPEAAREAATAGRSVFAASESSFFGLCGAQPQPDDATAVPTHAELLARKDEELARQAEEIAQLREELARHRS